MTKQSPAEVVHAFSQAVQSKDVEGVKRHLTATSLQMMQGAADNRGLSLDDFIARGGDMPLRETPELRNETQDGEVATMEVRQGTQWDRLALVREGDAWKIAFER